MSPRITFATLETGLFSKLSVNPSLTSSVAPEVAVASAAAGAGGVCAPKNEKARGGDEPVSTVLVGCGERGLRSRELTTSEAFCVWSVRCAR